MSSADDAVRLVKDGKVDEVDLSDHRDAVDAQGRTMLEAAAGIKAVDVRYATLGRLLDLGVDVPAASFGTCGVLNILLGAVKNDLDGLLPLVRRLLDEGADASSACPQTSRTPTMELCNLKFRDDDMVPLYDVWFAREGLDLDHRNKAGMTVLEMAERRGNRPELVRRIQEYAPAHPKEES